MTRQELTWTLLSIGSVAGTKSITSEPVTSIYCTCSRLRPIAIGPTAEFAGSTSDGRWSDSIDSNLSVVQRFTPFSNSYPKYANFATTNLITLGSQGIKSFKIPGTYLTLVSQACSWSTRLVGIQNVSTVCLKIRPFRNTQAWVCRLIHFLCRLYIL